MAILKIYRLWYLWHIFCQYLILRIWPVWTKRTVRSCIFLFFSFFSVLIFKTGSMVVHRVGELKILFNVIIISLFVCSGDPVLVIEIQWTPCCSAFHGTSWNYTIYRRFHYCQHTNNCEKASWNQMICTLYWRDFLKAGTL